MLIFTHTKTKGRKIYLSPGLVELGNETKTIHYELGQEMSTTFDLYLLIDNEGTRSLAQGLQSTGVSSKHIIFFHTTQQAHQNLGTILQPHDTIIFQNDLPDNY